MCSACNVKITNIKIWTHRVKRTVPISPCVPASTLRFFVHLCLLFPAFPALPGTKRLCRNILASQTGVLVLTCSAFARNLDEKSRWKISVKRSLYFNSAWTENRRVFDYISSYYPSSLTSFFSHQGNFTYKPNTLTVTDFCIDVKSWRVVNRWSRLLLKAEGKFGFSVYRTAGINLNLYLCY